TETELCHVVVAVGRSRWRQHVSGGDGVVGGVTLLRQFGSCFRLLDRLGKCGQLGTVVQRHLLHFSQRRKARRQTVLPEDLERFGGIAADERVQRGAGQIAILGQTASGGAGV